LDAYDDEAESGVQLLNEVESGGTLSSLFTILSLFTEDVKLRYDGEDVASGSSSQRQNEDIPFFRLDKQRRSSRTAHSRSGSRRFRPQSRPKHGSSSSDATVTADVEDSDYTSSEPEVDTLAAKLERPRGVRSSGGPSRPSSNASSSGRGTPSWRGQPDHIATPPRENTIARAAVDTTLAVIPAEAFRRLTKKFPNAAAHIVQGKKNPNTEPNLKDGC
jgi:lysophospholipid hydrolase